MLHHLNSGELKIIVDYFGAELCSVKNKNNLEFLWQADKAVWPRHAPVLFPVVGRLKNNQFIFKDKTYELSQHGFARDNSFRLISHSENSCTFQLVSNNVTKKNYPFDFVFEINYRLEQNKLVTSYDVFNPSKESLIFSIGGHPGFRCPLQANEIIEDYYLEFEGSDYSLTELSNGLRLDAKELLKLKDNKLFLSKQLFEKDALVFENSQINQISLCSSKSNHKITLTCKDWPYFGIWSKPGQPFVCLEPWYGIADKEQSTQKLLEKEGTIILSEGEKFKCEFSIAFY